MMYLLKIFFENKIKTALFVFCILIFVVFYNVKPDNNFPAGKIIDIKKGVTIKEVSVILEKENIIKSDVLFNTFVVFGGLDVVEGSYLFPEKINLFAVIKKISTGSYEIPIKKITFFEGASSIDMAKKIKDTFPDFDIESFLLLAKENEGYLFPDTYEFKQNVTPEEVVKVMRDNFDKKISSIKTELDKSEKSFSDIIIMASIIEKEATRDTMQDISNILWHRLDIDMPLQVDAPFVYEIGRGTFDLTKTDLKNDTPYNTYVNKGLTPTPIGNPGIKSISVAAFPKKTTYLYFLTGRDGLMYFANSFQQHKINRARYLD